MNQSPFPQDSTSTTYPPAQQKRVSARLPLSQPRWTYILLAANVLVWLAMTVLGLIRGLDLGGSESTAILLTFGAQLNSLVAQGEPWRLLTSMFLHIGLMHLLFNSYALFILGRDVESFYGPDRFLIIYMLSGLGGSLAFYLLGDNTPSAGASGAIFGLIGAEIAFFFRHRELFGQTGQRQLLNMLFVAGFNLFIGATVPAINNLAHMGGLVTGLALGWLLVPEYATPSVLAFNPGHAVPQTAVSREVITLEDRNSLRRRLPAVAAVGVILLLMGVGGTLRWSNVTPLADLDRAIDLLGQADYPAAATLLRDLADEHPDDGVVLFYQGVAEANLGNIGAAQRAWTRSVELEPEIAGTHWNLALIYSDQGRVEDAIAELETYKMLTDLEQERQKADEFIQELRR